MRTIRDKKDLKSDEKEVEPGPILGFAHQKMTPGLELLIIG